MPGRKWVPPKDKVERKDVQLVVCGVPKGVPEDRIRFVAYGALKGTCKDVVVPKKEGPKNAEPASRQPPQR
jgi:hypothetical protein